MVRACTGARRRAAMPKAGASMAGSPADGIKGGILGNMLSSLYKFDSVEQEWINGSGLREGHLCFPSCHPA
jgi:hypothetical protein